MLSPVLEFRPVRAGRLLTENVPNPVRATPRKGVLDRLEHPVHTGRRLALRQGGTARHPGHHVGLVQLSIPLNRNRSCPPTGDTHHPAPRERPVSRVPPCNVSASARCLRARSASFSAAVGSRSVIPSSLHRLRRMREKFAKYSHNDPKNGHHCHTKLRMIARLIERTVRLRKPGRQRGGPRRPRCARGAKGHPEVREWGDRNGSFIGLWWYSRSGRRT